MARAICTLPGMQTKAQEDLPLKEVSAGESYRVRGLAPRADNLIDDSRHGFITYFTGGVPHMKYALQSVVLATLFYKRDSGPGVGELAL